MHKDKVDKSKEKEWQQGKNETNKEKKKGKKKRKKSVAREQRSISPVANFQICACAVAVNYAV